MAASLDHGKDCDLAHKTLPCVVPGIYPKAFLIYGNQRIKKKKTLIQNYFVQ